MAKVLIQVSNKQAPANDVAKGENVMIAKSKNQKKAHLASDEEILEVFDEAGGIKKGSFISNLLVKAAIIAFINIIAIAGIIYFDRKIPTKALEIKRLRSEQLGIGAQNLDIVKKDLENNSDKIDKLLSLFPDDSGLVVFANELDRIKAEGKVIGFSFAAESAIKDKTGSIGIPVLIEIKGTWPEIDTDLQKIESLPFLLRAIEIEAQPAPEGEGIIDFKFGGFLYVGKDFGKN